MLKATHFAIVITAGSTKMYISSTRADVSDTVQGAMVFEFARDNPSLKAFTYGRATGMPCQILPLEIAGDTYTPAPFGAK